MATRPVSTARVMDPERGKVLELSDSHAGEWATIGAKPNDEAGAAVVFWKR